VTGTVIIVNGASSAGKTSLVRAFQDVAADMFLEIGLDRFIFSLPRRFLASEWADVLGNADSAGATGHRLVRGLHATLATLAGTGINVIADHVMVEPAWGPGCADALADTRAYLIGLMCPLDVLEARERSRKDRTLGQARKQHDKVHSGLRYDLEIDSSVTSIADSAALLWRHVSTHEPRALRALQRPRA